MRRWRRSTLAEAGRAIMEDGASMVSTPSKQQTDLHDPVLIDPEVVLAARADRMAAANAEARRLQERSAQPASTEPPPLTVDPTLRTADAGDALSEPAERGAFATWIVRTIFAVLFAVCSAVAAAAWQSYGDQAQEVVARWMPRITLTSSPASDAPAAQPATGQTTAADDQAAQQPVATAAAAPTLAAVPAATTPSAESTQQLQSMANDIAAMSQQISDLKATIAQLKASQEHMAKDLAKEMARTAEAKPAERAPEPRAFDPKAIEQTLRPRPAPRPAAATATGAATPGTTAAAAPVHRPRPAAYPAAPVAAPPMALPSAPAQATADDGLTVVRPPTPVR